MASITQEELRDKFKHYEQKEKDLHERERLFEIRMKDLHENFAKEKGE